jgi:hypothetical protein
MTKASVIKPGLLVQLKTTMLGGVRYERVDLNADRTAIEGQDVARWETTRVIEDKIEYDAATKARSQAASLVRKVCQTTSFGLLCPQEQEGALDAAIVAAQQLVKNHNEQAEHTRLAIFVLKGRVAADDAEAAKAITSEIAELVTKMNTSIDTFDPKAIRDAADRARELSAMLGDEERTKVSAAIAQARAAARTIVKRIEKEGEDRSMVLLDIQRSQIEKARITFLDLSGEHDQPVEPMPSVDAQRFAEIEMQP